MDQPKHKPRRVSFSDVAQGRHDEFRRLGDNVTKSESFRDEVMNTKLRKDLINDQESDEYCASIAAAAFAIYSLEETRAEFERRMRESFREDPPTNTANDNNNASKDQQKPLEFTHFEGLPRRSSMVEDNVGGGPIEVYGPRQRRRPIITKSNKANAWEQARLAKINKWYEKMNAKIIEWEKEKKRSANLELDLRKVEIERLKRINLSHHQNKIDRVENVAGGARIQLEEKKRRDEISARNKARKIRTTGKLPTKCFCFEY